MRKRVAKKVSKYRCLKCGSYDGCRSYKELKNGRLVVGKLYCMYCDMGMPRS